MGALDDLRALTGAGLLACKRALEASQGSVEKAARRLLRDGQAPGYRPQRKRRSEVPRAAVARGYRFDTWSEVIATTIDRQLAAMAPEDRPATLLVSLGDLGFWPELATATLTSGARQDLNPYVGWDVGEFAIPDSADEEDLVLEHFFNENLDNSALEIEAFSITDYFVLPGALWRLALHDISRRVRELSGSRGTPLSSCTVQIHDDTLRDGDVDMLWGAVREELVEHLSDDQLFEAFRLLAYETPSMQDRLRALRAEGLGGA